MTATAVGTLRVWCAGFRATKKVVASVEEAKAWIRKETAKQLKDRLVTWNAFGMEVFEDGDWTEWYSDEGESITEMIDREDEESTN